MSFGSENPELNPGRASSPSDGSESPQNANSSSGELKHER